MSNFLSLFTFVFCSFLAIVATAFWSTFIVITAIIKLIIPIKKVSVNATLFANKMMWCWSNSLAFILRITNPHIVWDIDDGIEGLSKDNWYLLVSNHQTWADIVILCIVFRNYIPQNKFFLKHQLIWIPFLGMACWALGMPFMKRYSKKFLLKHPELRGQDIETTRKSCEQFQHYPTTIVNFIEGTRFTENKRIQSRSPFNNLLPPKTAGIAFTLNILGQQFDKLINVTLYYPDNKQNTFFDLLCGKLKRIVVRVKLLNITDDMHGDYFNDKSYKRHFQLWLTKLWKEKDQLLDEIKEATAKKTIK